MSFLHQKASVSQKICLRETKIPFKCWSTSCKYFSAPQNFKEERSTESSVNDGIKGILLPGRVGINREKRSLQNHGRLTHAEFSWHGQERAVVAPGDGQGSALQFSSHQKKPGPREGMGLVCSLACYLALDSNTFILSCPDLSCDLRQSDGNNESVHSQTSIFGVLMFTSAPWKMGWWHLGNVFIHVINLRFLCSKHSHLSKITQNYYYSACIMERNSRKHLGNW